MRNFAAVKTFLVIIYIMFVKNLISTFQKQSSEGVPKYILLKQMQNQQQEIKIPSS